MDTTLKQRILGVVVLIVLLGFCLTVLLRNTKETTPHVAKINIHPNGEKTTTLAAIPPSTPVAKILPMANPASSPKTAISSEIEKPAVAKSAEIPPLPTPTTAQPQALVQGASSVGTPPAVTETKITPTPDTLPLPIATQSHVMPHVIPQASSTVSKLVQPKVQAQALPPVPAQPSEVLPRPTLSPPPPVAKLSHKTVVASSTLKVQVGTFSVPANAKALAQKLRENGFVATTQKVKTAKGEMTRVIVGKRGLSHAEVEALRQKLHQSLNLPGIIVSS